MENAKLKNLISISIIAFMIAGVFALPVINDDYSVQAATKKVKVIYKANGGKFTAAKYASKTTVVKKVKKGKKRGTAPKIKRAGYTLKGWYTKKSGGKKVTAKTRIKKKTVLYAQWKRTLNSEEKKIVGTWGVYFDGSQVYKFYNDGTYIMVSHFTSFPDMRARGFWSINNGILTKTAQYSRQTNKDTAGYFEEWGYIWTPWGNWETSTRTVRFGVDTAGVTSYPGKQYFDEYTGSSFNIGTCRFIKDLVGYEYQ